jgi:hypothetical protein
MQAAQMAFSLAVLCGQIGLDKIPGYFGSYGPSTHAQNVHMIVFDALPGREVIMDQPGTNSLYFVGADRCAYPATAYSNATLDFACGNCLSERDHEIGIVVTGIQAVRTEVRDFMASSMELGYQLLFEAESTVVSRNAHLHFSFLLLGPVAASSASINALSRRIRPPGMELSPLSSWPRGLTFSVPVTTQRIWRARLMTGYVSVIPLPVLVQASYPDIAVNFL